MQLRPWCLVLAPFALVACDAGGSPPTGPGVALTIAPLKLAGIGGACFDIAVWNAPGGPTGGGQKVWSQGIPGHQVAVSGPDRRLAGDAATICSNEYGNGAGGDTTYIGTCDADGPNGRRMNSVTVWFDGLYDADGGYIDPTGTDGWQDPCGAKGCTLDVLCRENADAAVTFDFTVMRDAQQGFFDVAVNFADVFCSAKYDTCYAGGGNESALDDEWIELLFGDDGDGHPEADGFPVDGPGRDRTGVLALACTGGPDTAKGTDGQSATPDTLISYSAVQLTCGSEVFDLDLTPATDPEGNQIATGSHGTVLQYALYFGSEGLDCDDPATSFVESCNKEYLNIAIDLEDLPTGPCRLRAQATAEASDAPVLVDGQLEAAGTAHPYVDVDVSDAARCQANPLNGPGGVKTVYASTFVGGSRPLTMCYLYAGGASVASRAFAAPHADLTHAASAGTLPLPLPAGQDGVATVYPRRVTFGRYAELLGKGCTPGDVRKSQAFATFTPGASTDLTAYTLVLGRATVGDVQPWELVADVQPWELVADVQPWELAADVVQHTKLLVQGVAADGSGQVSVLASLSLQELLNMWKQGGHFTFGVKGAFKEIVLGLQPDGAYAGQLSDDGVDVVLQATLVPAAR